MMEFIAKPLGRYVVIGLAGAIGVLGFMWQQQSVGVRKERARVEKTDKRNVSNADRAARASRDPAARGVRDPHVRND